MREIIQTEIQTKAEQKCPGYLEGQRRYAKQYRANVHSWGYGRLLENLQTQATKVGIAIEEGLQPLQGSPQEQAKAVAIAGYQSRK